MISMKKEESMLVKRLLDLSQQSYYKGIVTFSEFLNLNEQNIFHTCIPELYGGYSSFGGYEGAERQMIAFLPDALPFSGEYPFFCCKAVPVNRKFSDAISHRDVLGSLMALGIQRNKIGDILIKDNDSYFFCHESILSYVMETLTQIRHTNVSITKVPLNHISIGPELVLCHDTISSNRLDSLVASMCKISRSRALELMKNGKVFINGKEMLNSSYSCKTGEIISIRGQGRFQFHNITGETKKGRMKVEYYRYV